MEKEKFTKREKAILFGLKRGESIKRDRETELVIGGLWQKGYIYGYKGAGGESVIHLSEKAELYFINNPKLRNPTILDEKKWLIGIVVTIIGIVLTVIGWLFF